MKKQERTRLREEKHKIELICRKFMPFFSHILNPMVGKEKSPFLFLYNLKQMCKTQTRFLKTQTKMSSNTDHKDVAALLHGQGCANSLKKLLENREISSVSTEPLINTILDSFSLALSFMDFPPHHESSFINMAGHVPQRSSKK